MTLGDVKRISRNYAAVQLRTHLRDEVLVDAINDAVAQWCVYVGYPRIEISLTLTAGNSYADVGDRHVQDIEAVYYEDKEGRLERIYRGSADAIVANANDIDPYNESTPTKYFYEEVMVNNAKQKRVYIYNEYGLFVSSVVKSIIFIYTGVPEAFVPGVGDESKSIVIPAPYAYDLKYFVAFVHYNRVGDDDKAKTQFALWQGSKLMGYMLMNDSTRDIKQTMGDVIATKRRLYIDRY